MKTSLLEDSTKILSAIARGDRSAFQQLYDLHSEKVYNTALSYARNKDDAEEITQDVFVTIFRKANTFKGQSAVSTWIYRIAVNTSLNYLKKKKRYSFLSFGEPTLTQPDFDHPGVLLENKENAKRLFAAIHKLPDSQKTAIILSYVEDLPRQKVADIMDTSLKAVESLLIRAKKNLKNNLENIPFDRRKKG